MSKDHILRVPEDVWTAIEMKADVTLGTNATNLARSYLVSGVNDVPAYKTTTNSVAAPVKKKKPITKSMSKMIYLLWLPKAMGSQFIYDKKEIDDLFFIYKAMGPEALKLANELLLPEDCPFEDDNHAKYLEDKSRELHEMHMEWKKKRKQEERDIRYKGDPSFKPSLTEERE